MSQSEVLNPPPNVSKRLRLKKIAIRIIVGLSATICLLIGMGFIWVWYGGKDFAGMEICCAPADLTATAATGVVKLHWKPVPNAIFYQIDKSNTPGGPYWLAGSPYGDVARPHRWPVLHERLFYRFNIYTSAFGRVPYTNFTDTDIDDLPESLHYYRVRAFIGEGWTPWTSPISIRVADSKSPPISITIDASQNAGLLVHKWDIVGMEHIGYILDDNGIPREHGGGTLNHALATAHQRLGFGYVIAHGVFMSDLGIVSGAESTKRAYQWSRLDAAYDKIISAGLKPIVQLGFMPSELAIRPGAETIYSYHGIASPPKDYQEWADLVHALALHLESRYGADTVRQWAFDVWNEPDICVPSQVCYWHGSEEEYFKLYDYSVEAIRSVDPLLQVGGPVAMFPEFINAFLKHVANHHYTFRSPPLDFLDTRVYDAPVQNWRPLLDKYHLNQAQIWYTEWGLHNLGETHITDSVFSAPWIVNTVLDSADYVDHMGFWDVSDDFVEKSIPHSIFHGGYGLIGLYEIPKPSYWAYYLLNQMGHTKVAVSIAPSEGSELIRSLATADSNDAVQILLSNATKDEFLLSNAEKDHWQNAGNAKLDRAVTLSINGLIPHRSYSLKIYRVDVEHTNVLGAWEHIGSPAWPTPDELTKIRTASQLQILPTASTVLADSAGSLSIEVSSPMPSLSLVSLGPSDSGAPR